MSEQSEWTRRIDRLLAGGVGEQVGSAIEAVFDRLGELAKSVEELGGMRAPIDRLVAALTERYEDGGAKRLDEIGDTVSGLSAAVHGVGRVFADRSEGALYRVEAKLSNPAGR